MKEFNQRLTLKLIFSIILSVLFPLGVLGIIFGAVKSNTLNLVLGIISTVVGFYGAPISWIAFGNQNRLKTLLNCIVFENMYSVEELATHLNSEKQNITKDINELILKGYLRGYIFKEGYLELNTNKKQTGSTNKTIKCNNCGGTMVYDGLNYVCEYCGNVIRK